MCGIVGYVGKQKAAAILIEGLKRLEYRGYDSAGIAVLQGGQIDIAKKTGRVENLVKEAARHRFTGTTGIGHTRWATHGGVTDANAHPHASSDGKFALIHNGVIENYAGMKKFLVGKGYAFSSETDTEALCNLIAYHYAKEPEPAPDSGKSRFFESVRRALMHVEGTYGIAALCTDCPGEIVAARKASPLVLGVGDQEYILASDVAALVSRTQNVVYLKDGELLHITPKEFSIITQNEEDVDPVVDTVSWNIEAASLGDYKHYMEKEIFEQPAALENSMRGRFSEDGSTANFGGLNLTAAELRQVDRIVFLGCGTAWHACLVAEHLIERFARLPVEVDYASEFRYRNTPLDRNTLFFVLSQSGETIDTLGALREAKRKGYKVLAINNTVGSSIARESDGGIYQHVGPEIGVASTKAFTSQILIGAMLALYIARMRDMSYNDGLAYAQAIKSAPDLVRRVLETQAAHIRDIAKRYAHYQDMLFLGRLSLFPIALEGALKLKEISYIHAEGYPAAEMKHGPIALVSEKCPAVFFAPKGEIFNKLVSSIQEIKARKGKTIVITTEGCEFPPGVADEIIHLPDCHEAILPVIATIPVQLLSYHIALERGCDVDKPRNLAKSVTVE
ncbi:glucosamine--fructose-6-phosphate aminotransferase (isomerizing) [Ereboglobus sp. PH5-5]|uniref:glutamine--fructose-6-phosphate transaminase (isomerizing) n=1 Tax=unclassified Ereboglobus TaxID=2626932 RepID=UPI0024070896|nr:MULTISPECIES: glutamine--fructose-6-phosphate transaminase (isomerizing) [unclassified Ereboglobus]MDF9826417.1 glucosamine--fructose-6-phosphate aminotransferase (isomerizing) [Ereboglobus sp. PH5-10]MDF9832962.1 glucosamine--fructose-6-phosphate aminotransferase (isomerizing) [Ereboglobus sp. PH5-5]